LEGYKLPNQEDYLDNLLDSIQDVRHQKSKEERDADKRRQARYQERRRVKPDDDFLESTGLKDYEPKTVERKNLRRALSEEDFLKDFEAELDGEDSDNFINDFEKDLNFDLQSDYDNSEQSKEYDVSDEIETTENQYVSDESVNKKDQDISDEYDSVENQDISDETDNTENQDISDETDITENNDISDETDITEDNDASDETDIAENNDISDEYEHNNLDEDDGQDFSLESIMANAEAKIKESNVNDDEKINEQEAENSASDNNLLQPEFQPDEMDLTDKQNLTDVDASVETQDSDNLNIDSGEMQSPDTDTISQVSDDGGLSFDGSENVDLTGDSSTDDLMSLLEGEGSGDLGEISNLLNADSNGETLPEAEENYEDNVAGVMDEPGPGDPDFSGADEPEKKQGFIQKLLSVFKKKEKKDDKTVVLKEEKPEIYSDENNQILSEMENEEVADPDDDGTGLIFGFFKKLKVKNAAKKEEKKNQPKKEKPKKEKAKKEKPKKEPKPPKPPKPKDNSPRISMKVIIATFVLAVSIVAFIQIGTSMYADMSSMKEASSLYSKGESDMECYVDAYNVLAGGTYTGDEEKFYKQTAQMADVVSRIDRYNSFISKNKYEMALNELIMAYGRYKSNSAYIKDLGIQDIYKSKIDIVTQALNDQFNVTPDKAYEIFKISTRKKYTKAVNEILTSLNMTSKN
jgi:hypothetical protein